MPRLRWRVGRSSRETLVTFSSFFSSSMFFPFLIEKHLIHWQWSQTTIMCIRLGYIFGHFNLRSICLAIDYKIYVIWIQNVFHNATIWSFLLSKKYLNFFATVSWFSANFPPAALCKLLIKSLHLKRNSGNWHKLAVPIFQNALNLEYCQTKQITFAFLSALAISEKMISLFDLIWKSWRIENKSKISIVPFKNKSKVIHSWCKRSQQRSSITRWIYYLMIVLIVKILSVDAMVILR